jgi:hypothetical protein
MMRISLELTWVGLLSADASRSLHLDLKKKLAVHGGKNFMRAARMQIFPFQFMTCC